MKPGDRVLVRIPGTWRRRRGVVAARLSDGRLRIRGVRRYPVDLYPSHIESLPDPQVRQERRG